MGEPLESYAASAFTLAGTAMLSSLLVPVALGAVVDWAWAPGIVLAGTGLLAVTAGLVCLYPRVNDRSPALAMTGAVSVGVAGLGSLGLLGLIGVAAAVAVGGGPAPPAPVELFMLLALSVTAGLSVGFLTFGVSIRRAADRSRTAGTLLVGGGALLVVATVGELLRLLAGVGPPPWVVFPVIVLLVADLLAVGHTLDGGR